MAANKEEVAKLSRRENKMTLKETEGSNKKQKQRHVHESILAIHKIFFYGNCALFGD